MVENMLTAERKTENKSAQHNTVGLISVPLRSQLPLQSIGPLNAFDVG